MLFAILFIHLDANDLQPRNILFVNALIGIIGLFLYRRRISIKLCKEKIHELYLSRLQDHMYFSAGEFENFINLSFVRIFGFACCVYSN